MEVLDQAIELSVLYEISAIPTRLTEIGQIGALVVDKATRLLGNDVAIFYLHHPETDTLRPQASRGVLLARLAELPLANMGQAVAHAIAGKRPLSWRREDSAAMPDLSGVRYTVQAAICAPVRAGDELLGLIYAARLKDRPFTASEQSLFGVLADRAASAIENVRLIESGQRRTMQLQTAAEVSSAASSILDPDDLLPQAVELIHERFGLYYAGIFLVDETGKYAVLQAGTDEAGRKMLEMEHKLEVGGMSMIGWCVANRQARIALDVGKEAVHFGNPLLPETRSEMALPLVSRGKVIGAMTIQSVQEAAFSQEDIAALQTMADQLANAIQNARLFRRAQESLQEVEATHHRYLREEWEKYTAQRPMLGYEYDLSQVTPLQETLPVELSSPLREGRLVTQSGGDAGEGATLLAPITLGGETIGVLGFEEPERPRHWTPDETALIEAVTSQLALALENRRLFEEARIRAEELAALNELAQALTASLNVEEVLDAAYRGASRLLDTTNFYVSLCDLEAGEISFPLAMEDGQQVQWPSRRIGNGLTEYIIRNQTPVLIYEDLSARLVEMDVEQVGPPALSWLGVPLLVGDRVLGTMAVQNYTTLRAYDEHDRDLLTAIASQTAIALQSAYLFDEAQRRARRERIAREITAKITSSTDLDAVLKTTAQELGKALGTSHSLIRLGTPHPVDD